MKIQITDHQLTGLVKKILEEQISSSTLFRKLSFKSKMNYGKYAELTVQEIINLGKSGYLRWTYYNMSGISFLDEVLQKIGIIGDDVDYRIEKPGKNPDYGEEVQEKIYGSYNYSIKRTMDKNVRMDNIRKDISFNKQDNSEFSKRNLQRKNHGHY